MFGFIFLNLDAHKYAKLELLRHIHFYYDKANLFRIKIF
jgi:hypothetical protein